MRDSISAPLGCPIRPFEAPGSSTQPPKRRACTTWWPGRSCQSRDPRRDFCAKQRLGEKRGPHIDRHLTSRCCRTSSQIVDCHTNYDIHNCGGPIGSKRRQERRSYGLFAWFLVVFSARRAAFTAAFAAKCRPAIMAFICQWFCRAWLPMCRV